MLWLIEMILGMILGFLLFQKWFYRTLWIILKWIVVTLFHLLRFGFGSLERKFFPEIIKPKSSTAADTFDKTALPKNKEVPLKYAELSEEEIREIIKNHPELVTMKPKAGGD
jgi:hypothetical protein